MNRTALRLALACLAVFATSAASHGQFYEQVNLVSSVPAVATNTDPDLKNPWGISFSATGPFWVSDEATGLVTLYNTAGSKQGLVVTVPGGHPTGQVFNTTADFLLSTGGRSLFLFATNNGSIAGWNAAQGTVAPIMVMNAGAAYTGLAVGAGASGSMLYAANNAAGAIDVFDGSFAHVFLSGAFTDPNLPAGCSPYNVQCFGSTLFVTYQSASGGGVVDAFDLDGNLLRRVTSNAAGGPLDDPWGLAIAPASFGTYAGALLVGNQGDGRISAFDALTGTPLGQLLDGYGAPIANPGLWGLIFGNGGNGGSPDNLYFAAGIRDNNEGLFGYLAFTDRAPTVPEPGVAPMLMAGIAGFGWLLGRRRARSR